MKNKTTYIYKPEFLTRSRSIFKLPVKAHKTVLPTYIYKFFSTTNTSMLVPLVLVKTYSLKSGLVTVGGRSIILSYLRG